MKVVNGLIGLTIVLIIIAGVSIVVGYGFEVGAIFARGEM